MGGDSEDSRTGAGAELFFEVGYDRLAQARSVIEVRGTLRLGDLARATYFAALCHSWWFVVFTAALFVVVALKNPGIAWGAIQKNAIPFALLGGLWVFLMTVMPYRAAQKEFAAKGFLRDPIVYTFTPETVSSAGTGVSSTVCPWDRMARLRFPNGFFKVPGRSSDGGKWLEFVWIPS